MKLSNRQGKFLQRVIKQWQSEGTLNEQEAERLNNSFTIQSFDWKKLAKYSFWIAIVCGLISVCAAVADDYIIHLIESIFESSNVALCLVAAIIAIAFYFLGLRGRRVRPESVFSNEALLFVGVLFTAISVAYLGRALDTGSKHYSLLFLLAAVIYAGIGLWFPSKMVWVFALLSLGSWYGTEIGYRSGWGEYYLGMNYPLTFVFFGTGIVALAFIFKFSPRFAVFHKSTLKMGLLYLFIALWILSIFGNYGDYDRWYSAKQSELFGWALLFGAVGLAAMGFGIKTDDPITRGFGVTFLLINLYTRYFEYCWNGLHKALFFFILALSFGLIGRWAEKIWNVGSLQKVGEPSIPEEILEEE